ncbi:hypothetical protein PIB30_064795, partial [Stylosanthes scabra]|nr:hypothetical protein [Stylosanthes scabra]
MADSRCGFGVVAVALEWIVRGIAVLTVPIFPIAQRGIEIPPVCLLWSLFVFAPYLMWGI